jgi:hypothetical protein
LKRRIKKNNTSPYLKPTMMLLNRQSFGSGTSKQIQKSHIVLWVMTLSLNRFLLLVLLFLDNTIMVTHIQAEYEYLLREKNLHIKVLENQIKYKDEQLDKLSKAYGNVLIERDDYKKALEAL